MPVRMQTPKEAYTFDYPEAVAYADMQNSVLWFHHEINVEKDIQDIRVNMTEAEAHGVITTLKLFTLYELVAGNEYWVVDSSECSHVMTGAKWQTPLLLRKSMYTRLSTIKSMKLSCSIRMSSTQAT